MEKKTLSFQKKKRLHVFGALEVNNTRDTSRILSVIKGIYCFFHINFLLSFTLPLRILTLFGVAVLTRWWIYTGIYLIQKRLLWASDNCALGSLGGHTSKSMHWVQPNYECPIARTTFNYAFQKHANSEVQKPTDVIAYLDYILTSPLLCLILTLTSMRCTCAEVTDHFWVI